MVLPLCSGIWLVIVSTGTLFNHICSLVSVDLCTLFMSNRGSYIAAVDLCTVTVYG